MEMPPEDVVSLLIDLGKRLDPSSAEAQRLCEALRKRRKSATLHWDGWERTCGGLSIDDHIAILKGLTVAEELAGWGGGSVSPVIAAYRRIEPRVPIRVAQALAQWVLERSRNPWVPFGSRVLTEYFDPAEDLGEHREVLSEILKERRFAENARRRVAREKIDQGAKAKRLERLAKMAEEHQGRKVVKDDARAEVIELGRALDSAGRLRLVAERRDLPLLAFPVEWSMVDENALGTLPNDVLTLLVGRVSPMKRGPWNRLHGRLCAFLPRGGPERGPQG